jgi:hypothetical protein
MPRSDLPRGPDFFRFSDAAAFPAALREQGLASLAVTDIAFVQRFASADELWDGNLGATEAAHAGEDERDRRQDSDAGASIYAGRPTLRASWAAWPVEVRVLSGPLEEPRCDEGLLPSRAACAPAVRGPATLV